LWHLVTHLGQAQGLTAVVGLGSLAVVLVLRRFAPVVPAPLVAVLAGIVAVHVFGLHKHGVEIVGPISGGLPAFGLPHVPAADYVKLAASAVGVMLVGFAEGLGAAKTYAARDGYQISPDKELIGLGTANLAAGLSGGMVVNGSLSKTAVNGSAGARTQASGLAVAVLTVITLLFLTGLFEDLPEATLSAVVIADRAGRLPGAGRPVPGLLLPAGADLRPRRPDRLPRRHRRDARGLDLRHAARAAHRRS
jgi:SulP family sulfate permease